MKRVLGVVGSPRRNGNTHVLVSRILDGATEAGAQADLLFLNDMTIRECDGCQVCWQGKPCNKHDDMNGAYPQIIASDAIVFGTPVYWYAASALMKAFLDRFVYFNCPENRAKIRGRAAALAIPYEEESPDTVAPVLAMFEMSLRYLEMVLVGSVIAPGVGNMGDIMKRPELLDQARALGRKLAGA